MFYTTPKTLPNFVKCLVNMEWHPSLFTQNVALSVFVLKGTVLVYSAIWYNHLKDVGNPIELKEYCLVQVILAGLFFQAGHTCT